MLSLVSSGGQRVTLGRLLGKGGEGAVYELQGDQRAVAKVYHHPLSSDRAEKIRTMLGMANASLSGLTAWPEDLLLTDPGRQPIGLVMARVAASKDVHNLYGPKSRLQEFPRADWRFLVRSATNIARAFAIVQDAGVVIGDVNHGSILVGEDATVRLIDCDSFQITTPRRQFLCELGVETFTPPELQGVPFKGVVQTPNHDNFRLAIMVFHLLFMGRHPFAGRYLGRGEMPLGRSIKEFRFAYSVTNTAMQMDKPPGTPALNIAGQRMAGMFELAFSQSAVGAGRPSPRDWIDTLVELENGLKRCSTNHGHFYAGHLLSCPWCEMESLGANALFPFVPPPGSQLDIGSLWKQLNSLPNLEPPPVLTRRVPAASAEALTFSPPFAVPDWLKILAGVVVFLCLTIYFPALFFIWIPIGMGATALLRGRANPQDGRARFRDKLAEAQAKFDSAHAEWQLRTSAVAFVESRKRFQDAYDALAELPKVRLRRLDQLRQEQRTLQLNHFLDRFRIEDASISGIGPARKRMLVSYGIETAEDLVAQRIALVPGFGPKMADRLVGWRQLVEKRFVFDSAKAIDPRDTAKVEQDILFSRTKLETTAKRLHSEAMQRYGLVSTARTTLRGPLEALAVAVDQARADLAHVEQK